MAVIVLAGMSIRVWGVTNGDGAGDGDAAATAAASRTTGENIAVDSPAPMLVPSQRSARFGPKEPEC